MDLLALKTEITTDPAAIGYAGQTDEQIARLMMRENGTGAAFEINRKEISSADVASCVVGSEFIALAAGQRDYVGLIAGAGILKVKTVKDDLLLIFTQVSSPITRAALQDVFKQTVSRAVKVLGEGVTPSNIADARRA